MDLTIADMKWNANDILEAEIQETSFAGRLIFIKSIKLGIKLPNHTVCDRVPIYGCSKGIIKERSLHLRQHCIVLHLLLIQALQLELSQFTREATSIAGKLLDRRLDAITSSE